jgi:hypothetical protein
VPASQPAAGATKRSISSSEPPQRKRRHFDSNAAAGPSSQKPSRNPGGSPAE